MGTRTSLTYVLISMHLPLASTQRNLSIESILSCVGVIALLFWLQPTKYEYQKPLGDSFLFYEAHRSGVVLAAILASVSA